jgi:hypothetical protein
MSFYAPLNKAVLRRPLEPEHHTSTGVCNVLVPDLAVPSSPP